MTRNKWSEIIAPLIEPVFESRLQSAHDALNNLIAAAAEDCRRREAIRLAPPAPKQIGVHMNERDLDYS